MKKLISVLLVIFLSIQTMAQDTTVKTSQPSTGTSAPAVEAPRRFGIYGGVNFANIGGDSESYDESKTGYQFGFMYCLFSTGLLNCWVEPGYNAIGSKYNDVSTSGTISGTVNLGYFMVPIVARLQTDIGLFGDIGVQPQVLVSAKDKYSGYNDDYKDYVNGFDFGGLIGAGFEFRKRVGLSARYYAGFSNINKKDTDSKDHNSVFSFRLHVRL
jgi:outer membrane immunogenic protein